MRKIVGIVAAVGAVMAVMMFGEPTAQTWIGDGAYAQSSAGYQNCRNVRKWPSGQGRRYGKGRG